MNSKRTLIVAAGLAATLFAAGTAAAAEASFPTRTIKIVVPFPPGGSSDTVARLLAAGMSQKLGQTVIVDNRGGAGTIIGTDMVAKSPGDGYTLLWMATPFAINVTLFKSLPYDTFKDFTPVIDGVAIPLVLIVPPDSPYKSVAELIAGAKKVPGKLNYGSSGLGGSPHLATEMFASMAGIKLTHVPYKGSAPAVQDLLAGQTNMVFDTLFLTLPQIKAGKARALAQTGKTRSPLLPDVPTVAEAGLPGYEATSWLSVAAPASTPPEIIKKLNAAAFETLTSPELREVLLKQGATVIADTPQEATARLKVEVERWGKAVRESGATAE
jgi:tripartite-type tricarboxylate transporter receptor subunit TctC